MWFKSQNIIKIFFLEMHCIFQIFLYRYQNEFNIRTLFTYFGGARRGRTAGLLRARQALYQLSYGPIFLPIVGGSGWI